MPEITKPLRKEHQELLPYLEAIRDVAESVDKVSLKTLLVKLETIQDFLFHHLIPHARAEERVFYPTVEKIMGAKGATKTMIYDHQEIVRFCHEIARVHIKISKTLNKDQAKDLRQLLYGLYALVINHFHKEEDVYLPILDKGLSNVAAKEMFAKMEKAASEAKAQAA